MKETRSLMGMTVTIEVIDETVTKKDIENIYTYFGDIDNRFSTYKEASEISAINKGLLPKSKWSSEMQEIFDLSEKTKLQTKGYFDIFHNNSYDPSGIVKGWAIWNAAKLLEQKGFHHFYVDVGGDIQVKGKNKDGAWWTVGIRNPFNKKEIIKVVELENKGIATSGIYERGNHIYNPHLSDSANDDIVSLSVIGPNVFEADRFATAAFAMGKNSIAFIESQPDLEGYMIDKNKIATYTSGFNKYVKNNELH